MSSSSIDSTVQTTYDGLQHCLSVKMPQGKRLSMDCPYTGKGEEFSPTNLVESALAGCMLLAMGTLAMRNELNLSGTCVEVKITSTEKPVMRFSAIDVLFKMPRAFSQRDRMKLERAAEGCPIKHSFGSDIPVAVRYEYPS